MERVLNDQQKVRRQKMEDLRAKGINPFGNAFPRTAFVSDIRGNHFLFGFHFNQSGG